MSRRNPVLFRVLDSFFRYKWLFIVSVLVVTVTTMWIVTSRNSSYHSTALTQVSKQDYETVLGEQEHVSYISVAQQNVNRFSDLVNDDLPGGFLDTALRNANLSHPINLDPKADDERYKMLRNKLSAATQGSTLFGITLTWDDKRECEAIVSALQRQYIEEVGLDSAAKSIAMVKFLDSTLADYDKQLKRAQEALIDYRTRNGASTPEANTATVARLNDLLSQRDNLLIVAHNAVLKRQQIEAELQHIPKTSVKERTASASAMQKHLDDLKSNLLMLEARYLPTHPEVVHMKELIQNTEQQMREAAKANQSEVKEQESVVYQDNPVYQSLQDKLNDAVIEQTTNAEELTRLNTKIADYQARVRQMPAEERDLANKMRDFRVLQNQYERLKTRRENVAIKSKLDKVAASSTLTPIGRVVAQPGLTPAKSAVMLVASILFGLLIGGLLVVLSEWSDHSLRYEADAERLLGVPVLASIPETQGLRLLIGPGGRAGGGGSRKLLPKEKRTKALPAPASNGSTKRKDIDQDAST